MLLHSETFGKPVSLFLTTKGKWEREGKLIVSKYLHGVMDKLFKHYEKRAVDLITALVLIISFDLII